MTQIATWIEAARPKTWAASLSPVAFGSIAAFYHGDFSITLFLWILAAALAFQVSANYANDYFDCVQGADTPKRKGFRRVTATGLVTLSEMRRAIICSISIAALLSLYLIHVGGIAIACVAVLFGACTILYTAGKRSIAYLGLGEITVILFFGLIGVNTTFYLFTQTITTESILISWVPGLLASNVLLMNNMRDIEEDRIAGKKTIAVRFGLNKCKMLYLIQMCFTGGIPSLLVMASGEHFWTPLANIAFIPTLPMLRQLIHSDKNTDYNTFFIVTVKTLIFYTVAFSITYML